MLVEQIDTSRWSQRLLRSLDWKVFEDLCAALLLELGYEVARSPRKQVDGIDLIVRPRGAKDGPGIAVHCESSNHPLSLRQVGEFYSTMLAAGFEEGMFITTGVFNRRASEVFGQMEALQLITGRKFLEGVADLGSEAATRLREAVTSSDLFDVPTCPCCDIKMVEARESSLDLRWGRRAWVCGNRESEGCMRSFASGS